MGEPRRRTPNERAAKSTSIAQTQGFAPPEQHHCFSPNGLKINSRPTCCLGGTQAACTPCASGADPARSCCHGKAISLGCVHRSPPPPSLPHHSSSEPAFSLGRDRSSHQKQLSKDGKEAGTAVLASGERDSNQWWISAAGQRELRDVHAAWPGALSLQSPGTRTAGPLHKVAGPSAGQSGGGGEDAPEDWQALAGWTEALCVPAQSLQRSAAPSRGVCWAALRRVGGCFAATDLASTL